MSPFITDALAVGLKESVKLAVVWTAYRGLLAAYRYDPGGQGNISRDMETPFYAGLTAALCLSAVSFFISPEMPLADFLSRLSGYVFFVFFLSSVAAIYHETGTNLLGPLARVFGRGLPLKILIFALTVFYFSPDVVGSSSFVRELSIMKENPAGVYFSAALGFVLPLGALFLRPSRVARFMGRFFGPAQFLLFLAVVKLLGGGVKGFAEFSLIPSIVRGTMKFFHDMVHQTFVFLMVPDHPLLKVTVWNFIGILFGANIAIYAVLLVLINPPLILIYYSLSGPLPEPPGAGTGAERRLFKAGARALRRTRAVPAAFFLVVIALSWFSGRTEEISRLYNPKPLPVIDDKGVIIIPLSDPTKDLMDGMLHKFSFLSDQGTINILMIKKPDGKLAVCLDACEICPPEGYGQMDRDVVCIYCRTPIPVETLGKKGGCNPIPLEAEVSDRDVRINVAHLLEKWKDVKSGKTKEGLR